jgi:hypothetical protein
MKADKPKGPSHKKIKKGTQGDGERVSVPKLAEVAAETPLQACSQATLESIPNSVRI